MQEEVTIWAKKYDKIETLHWSGYDKTKNICIKKIFSRKNMIKWRFMIKSRLIKSRVHCTACVEPRVHYTLQSIWHSEIRVTPWNQGNTMSSRLYLIIQVVPWNAILHATAKGNWTESVLVLIFKGLNCLGVHTKLRVHWRAIEDTQWHLQQRSLYFWIAITLK